MSYEENDNLEYTLFGLKNRNSFKNEKNKINLNEKIKDLYNKIYSKGFINSESMFIWKDPTLSHSESRCIQIPTIGNIMKTNDNFKYVNNQNKNNNKTLRWNFEDKNNFNDKENIIYNNYKIKILEEPEWCNFENDKDSMMEENDNNNNNNNNNNKFSKSSLQIGKNQINIIVKKRGYQNISSSCESHFIIIPKKYSEGFKINNSSFYSIANDINDNKVSISSIFNNSSIKSMKANSSKFLSINSKKSSYSKKILHQLNNTISNYNNHKRSISEFKKINKFKKVDYKVCNQSHMNSLPIITMNSKHSPSFLQFSLILRKGISSSSSQSNLSCIPPKRKSSFSENDQLFKKEKKQNRNNIQHKENRETIFFPYFHSKYHS